MMITNTWHEKCFLDMTEYEYVILGRDGRDFFMSYFFTVNELAKYFKVHPKTIYRRLWTKGIPAYKVGRVWRIAKKDLK